MNESAGESRGILDATSYSLADRSRPLDNTSSFYGFDDDSQLCNSSVMQLLDKPFSQLVDGMQLRKNDRYSGFDNNAGDNWIYPTNYPVRKYQFSITQAALFKNTLVVLPTGLGKTFIAAVVMYNIYRWYPTGKVIFMAPTRPLVNQQIEACYKIMGIPKADTAEMTGKQQRKNRSGIWQSKRVFYVTPQVVLADLNSPEQNFPTNSVKLIVIDEAHKAKGRYAYAEVVKAIAATNRQFRVLALSATPGRTLEDVAEVIRNLLIAHIEVRWENSIDVSPYTFKKNIRTIVIPLGPKISKIRDDFIQIVDPYVRRLLDANVISGHTGNLSRGWLIMEQKRFHEACLIQRHPNSTAINSDFSTCVSLYHALELLIRHGVRAFLNFFEEENSSNEKYFVAKDRALKAFLDDLREEYGRNPLAIFGPNGETVPKNEDEKIDFGHPKFAILERHLRDHFGAHPDSKVIIFCEFRDSVAMIHRLLLQNRPLVKPRCIVGQGGSGGSNGALRAVTQKEQIAAMRDFRSGVCNTLIATCVAEEGIDVGEVDLIVCFDISKNPTRFVQRIGRTGRQRVGRVLMLATEGKEYETVRDVLASKDKTNQKLARSKEILSVLYRQSPRLVPTEFDPKCVETFIKIAEEVPVAEEAARRGKKRKNTAADEGDRGDVECPAEPSEKRKRRKNQDAPPRGTQDVRNFFRKTTADLDVSEREVFSSPPPKDVSADSVNTSTDTSRERLKIPTDNSIRLGKTDQEIELEKLMKPLLRHKARMDRQQYLKDRKRLALHEEQVSRSILCPNPLKKLFLEANVGKLRDLVEKSEVLQVALDGDSDDLILLDDRGDCVKSEIKIIEGLFDGRAALKERISDIEEYRSMIERLRPQNGTDSKQMKITEDQICKFSEVLAKFSTHAPKKHSSIEQPAIRRSTTPVKNPIIEAPSISNLFDSQFCLPPVTEPEESRYQPQKPPESSEQTPINRNKNKPRLNSCMKKTPAQDYANSPLLRAFNRSVQKAKNSDYATSPSLGRAGELGFRMVLEFFGLRSIDQVFEESKPAATSSFRNRLETIDEQDDQRSMTQHISELSKNLFDSKELNLEAQEAAFLAGDFSRNTGKEEEQARQETDLLEANFLEGDFSATEASKKRITQVPIELFLEDNFSDDEEPVIPTCDRMPSSSALNYSGQRKELDLDIQSCLAELIEEPVSPKEHETDSEEVIPNSQEAVSLAPFKSQVKPSQKNLDIGNLEDLFADSEDDIFSNDVDNNNPDSGTSAAAFIEVPAKQLSQKENLASVANQSEPVLPRTPSSSNAVKVQDRSPSLLRKKLNFSRLRLNGAREHAKLEMNSAPVGRMASLGEAPIESPFFASCRPVGGRSIDFRREPEGRPLNDMSVIHAPRTKRKAVISSQSEDSDEEEMFQTARSRPSGEMKPPAAPLPLARRAMKPVHRKKRRKHNSFLLDEAEVSGDEVSEDEDDDSELIDDSIVHHDFVEEHPSVDMRAKYLQSVRSPIRAGAFKIPAAPTVRHMNLSDIYSQVPVPDDQSYEICSFVVREDEEDEPDSEASSSSMDELERAEAILRERRRARKNAKNNVLPKATRVRRMIVSCPGASDSESEGEELKAFRRQIHSLDDSL